MGNETVKEEGKLLSTLLKIVHARGESAYLESSLLSKQGWEGARGGAEDGASA